MFRNYLHREAMKTDTVETLFKVSYLYNNNFTKEGYELPDIQFWLHMQSQIQNPCLCVTGYLQIGTHLYIHSFQLEVRAGFRHFTASFQ